jgi:hypothetical protein
MEDKNSATSKTKNEYDGHFDFRSLSAEQKLQWLAAIVMLAKMSKKQT